MVNIRTAISTSAAALVALSTVTGVSAASAQAEESTGTQPGTDAAASEDSDAQAVDEAQPGTEVGNDSADNNGGEEESTANDVAQPGTTADKQQPGLANQGDIPKHHETDNTADSAPAQPGTTQTTNTDPQEADNVQPGTATDDPSATTTAAPAGQPQPSDSEANASNASAHTTDEADDENSQNNNYVSRPQPVESDAATQTTTQWSDEVVYDDEPASGQQNTAIDHEEPVESYTRQPDYEFATYTSDDAADSDRIEKVDEQEETAPAPGQADEEGQAEEAPVEVVQSVQQPVESDTTHQSAPAPAEAVTQAPVNDMQPVDTNEVAGASASLTAGEWEVSAQGEAYPFEGTIAVDAGMNETSFALPSDEIAAVQQFGQDTVKALPTEQQDALNQAHKAVIEKIEHLPQQHSAELGSVTAEVNIDHAE
ncbi:TPA: hypothetical protein I8W37_002058 [Corynebacterium striatum]|nr:hypothetical protein [Corynebacterium striatum]HAT1163824.1 hypothetical protein [Corynebacterium striatum]HAT1166579.1 hypothetical protein [Corynebacterium striatum]HAT1169115.1 hypothetical protein [Corynebacterium striatum]HAT1174496.1 hypothetical protein [Corynebacterium striatum]